MKRAATALLVGLMLVAAVASVVVARERSRRPTAALARAVGPHRVTVARLTGGFSYAVCAKKDTRSILLSMVLRPIISPRSTRTTAWFWT